MYKLEYDNGKWYITNETGLRLITFECGVSEASFAQWVCDLMNGSNLREYQNKLLDPKCITGA